MGSIATRRRWSGNFARPTASEASMALDGCPTFAKAYVGRKRRAQPHDCFVPASQQKALETNHFRPRYAGANLGHPSRRFISVLIV